MAKRARLARPGQGSAVQGSAVQCSAMQCNAPQRNPTQCTQPSPCLPYHQEYIPCRSPCDYYTFHTPAFLFFFFSWLPSVATAYLLWPLPAEAFGGLLLCVWPLASRSQWPDGRRALKQSLMTVGKQSGGVSEWMNGWMVEWLNGWMDEWMNGWMAEWLNGCWPACTETTVK